ncbi:hypothetical protein C7M84_006052 [Penaeus vannamei]|uniref:Uncharacterized protein n=1 Tax=Penaeus vannamei TaxID=6689 RepID=A0A3R7SUA6_PENVA|nr:hypothetical protein C7M84_006052 [Penaeus vannamei]
MLRVCARGLAVLLERFHGKKKLHRVRFLDYAPDKPLHIYEKPQRDSARALDQAYFWSYTGLGTPSDLWQQAIRVLPGEGKAAKPKPVAMPVTENLKRDPDPVAYYGLPKELMPIHPGGGSRFEDLEKERLERAKGQSKVHTVGYLAPVLLHARSERRRSISQGYFILPDFNRSELPGESSFPGETNEAISFRSVSFFLADSIGVARESIFFQESNEAISFRSSFILRQNFKWSAGRVIFSSRETTKQFLQFFYLRQTFNASAGEYFLSSRDERKQFPSEFILFLARNFKSGASEVFSFPAETKQIFLQFILSRQNLQSECRRVFSFQARRRSNFLRSSFSFQTSIGTRYEYVPGEYFLPRTSTNEAFLRSSFYPRQNFKSSQCQRVFSFQERRTKQFPSESFYLPDLKSGAGEYFPPSEDERSKFRFSSLSSPNLQIECERVLFTSQRDERSNFLQELFYPRQNLKSECQESISFPRRDETKQFPSGVHFFSPELQDPECQESIFPFPRDDEAISFRSSFFILPEPSNRSARSISFPGRTNEAFPSGVFIQQNLQSRSARRDETRTESSSECQRVRDKAEFFFQTQCQETNEAISFRSSFILAEPSNRSEESIFPSQARRTKQFPSVHFILARDFKSGAGGIFLPSEREAFLQEFIYPCQPSIEESIFFPGRRTKLSSRVLLFASELKIGVPGGILLQRNEAISFRSSFYPRQKLQIGVPGEYFPSKRDERSNFLGVHFILARPSNRSAREYFSFQRDERIFLRSFYPRQNLQSGVPGEYFAFKRDERAISLQFILFPAQNFNRQLPGE